jgi:adenylate cyclase
MARILVETNSEQRWVELELRTTIGRHPAMTVRVADKIVSKHHCTLEQRDDTWVLVDNETLNGTFVNAERIEVPRILRLGDAITIGQTRLTFDDRSAPLPPHAPWVPPDAVTPVGERTPQAPPGATLLPEYEDWQFMATKGRSKILERLPMYRGVFSMFPSLGKHVPQNSRHVRMHHESGYYINARTNVDNPLTLAWALAGGLVWGTQPDHDVFLAAILTRRTDKLVVVMTRPGLTFNFLGKLDNKIVEQENTASALDNALLAWDHGESVHVTHGWPK